MCGSIIPDDVWEVLTSIKNIPWHTWVIKKVIAKPSGSMTILFKEPKFWYPLYVEVVSEYDSKGERITSYEATR